jgi:hypothetical protein
MTSTHIRGWIAIIVVGVFMTLTVVMALFPLFAKVGVTLDEYSNFFIKIMSGYTGMVGIIIGYYFGKFSERDRPPAEEKS